MGLRSLYTILSKAATDLKYLEPAVALVLGFIGGKMIAEYMGYIIPTSIALAVVGTLLSAGVGLSVLERNENAKEALVEDSLEPWEQCKQKKSKQHAYHMHTTTKATGVRSRFKW